MTATHWYVRFLVATLLTLLAACSREPPDPGHEFQQGIAAFQSEEYARAARSFERALTGVPDHAQALNFLAVCELHLGHPEAARDLLVRALEQEPGYGSARYNLGLAWLELDQPDKAIAELRQAARQGAVPANAEHQLGLAYIRASAWVQAEEALTRAAQAGPDSAETLNLLGIVNSRLRRWPQAVDYFRRALVADPNLSAAHLNLAITLHDHLDRSQEALSHYRRHLELAPQAERRDQVRSLIDTLSRADSIRPDRPSPPTPGAAPTASPSAPARPAPPAPAPVVTIEPAAVTAVPVPPAPTGPTTPAAKTRVPTGVNPLRSGNRSRAAGLFNRGVQAQQRGAIDEALSTYRAAIEADPTFAAAYYNLGILHAANLNRPGPALDYYELALQADPDYSDARFNYAILLQSQGYLADAIRQFERLIEANPRDAGAHLSIGTLYARNRDTATKARVHYRAYLRLARLGGFGGWCICKSLQIRPGTQKVFTTARSLLTSPAAVTRGGG